MIGPVFTLYFARGTFWWSALGLFCEMEQQAAEVDLRGYISAEDELCRLGAILLELRSGRGVL